MAQTTRCRIRGCCFVARKLASKGFAKEVPDDANALLVKGRWLARANLRIIPGAGSTQIHVSPGASYPGLIRLADRIGIVRKVQHALADSGELTGSS